jgi:hypothetical protein
MKIIKTDDISPVPNDNPFAEILTNQVFKLPSMKEILEQTTSIQDEKAKKLFIKLEKSKLGCDNVLIRQLYDLPGTKAYLMPYFIGKLSKKERLLELVKEKVALDSYNGNIFVFQSKDGTMIKELRVFEDTSLITIEDENFVNVE